MMRWLLTLVGLSLSTATANPLFEPSKLELLVPAYFYPGTDDLHWPALNAAAGKVPLTVIMNPASGPGEKADPAYVEAVAKVRAAGATVIGYVHISYGKRPMKQVQADVELYRNLYEIDGIFLDEMASDSTPKSVSYQSQLISQIKADSPDWTVVGNPGVMPDAVHLGEQGADIVVSFEDTAAQWLLARDGDLRSIKGPRSSPLLAGASLAQLVHTTTDEQLVHQIVSTAAMGGIKALYITNDKMDNPWDTLPVWWTTLVDHIAAINSGA
ncbi:MAG: spherulation-specific family 4 protein [Burkholderiaceae bacterium]